MVSRDDLKLMLEIQQKAYKDATELLMTEVTNRMRHLEQRNQELVHSLEFTQREVDGLKSDNSVMKEELCNLKKELAKKTDADEKINKINDRLDYQEDYSRRNNLRFDGLEEKSNESWEATQDMVQRLLREKLNIGPIQLERAHRVGPRPSMGTTRPRTVVARFTSFSDRQLALKNASKLKNTNIYINEDLCEASVQLRKAQLSDLRKARAEGKIAYFSHTKLVIRDRSERRFGAPGSDSQTTSATATGLEIQHLPSESSKHADEAQRDSTSSRSTRQKKQK